MKNFIVLEASAGSGKTYNLAKRYISLLLNCSAPTNNLPLSNILALTFANKATVEMKERIIKYLKKIALENDLKNFLEDIKIPKNKISKNALNAINILIENFEHFNVRTIDSFLNLIIKASALKLGISPNYKILNSYDDYIDYSVDTFLDKSFENKKIQKILDVFFEQYVVDSKMSWNIRGNILETFKKLYKNEFIKKIVKIDKVEHYSTTLLIISSKFKNICTEISKIKDLENLVDKKMKDYAMQISLGTKTLLKDGISTYFLKEEVQYKSKIKEYNKQLDELFIQAKQIIQEFAEFKAKNYYNNYIQMFEYIVNEFNNKTKLDSVMFLQDINKQVSKIFDKENLAPEIYLRLSNRFTDCLIDEFQDTNKIQWQILKLIVSENLSNGGSFFYVGDKKQAIYGFRGSDYKIFDIPKQEFINYNPQEQNLDVNFRSCQAIVDFNNAIYSKENIESLLKYIAQNNKISKLPICCKEIVDVFSNSKQKCSKDKQNLGFVEISYKEYVEKETDIDEEIKQYLYNTIDDIKQRFDYKDITIICRENKEIEKVGRWLLEKGIDIQSFQTLNIINSNIIKELFSIIEFFNLPIDNIAFACFITSSIFLKATNLQKEDMIDFITKNSINNIGNKDKIILYILFKKAYPQIWKDYIEEFFKSAGFVAVYEMVVLIISKYKILENFCDYSNIILRFLEVISDFEKDNQGLQNFIDYFKNFENDSKNEKFFVKIPSSNAITITTAHKSKGLQFNVVIMPYFYIEQSKKVNNNVFAVENKETVSFLEINKKLASYSKYLEDIYYQRYFKNISDELNVLYVSTTRAVYEFYALITQKKQKDKKEKNNINYLINEQNRKFGIKQKYENIKKEIDDEKIEHIPLQPTQLNNIIELLDNSSIELYGKKNEDVLLKGKIIHYALSLIESFELSNLDNLINSAIQQVSIMYQNENLSWLKEKLKELLSNENVLQFFNDKYEVYNEKEFVDKFGNTIRLDKLIIKQNTIDIVDFKNSIYDKVYIDKQMKKYADVLKEIYLDKKINCYVINIENKEVLEIC